LLSFRPDLLNGHHFAVFSGAAQHDPGTACRPRYESVCTRAHATEVTAHLYQQACMVSGFRAE
jgi:hypothetical protein